MKGHRVRLSGDRIKIAIPAFARVRAKLAGLLVEDQIPRTFDVTCGERLAVMPFDARTHLEGQFSAFLVPRPACRKIRSDRVHAVFSNMLIVDHEVVKHRHYWVLSRIERLFE